MQLNNLNYHSVEANRHYMSNSQYKDFMTCEASALAKLNGEWRDEPSDALLVGSYVDAHFEGTLDEFKAQHPELFSSRGATKGELKAQYQHADLMIEKVENDPFCAYLMRNGDKQTIMTGEFAGTMWKVKFDIYNPQGGRIIDLKTTKSIREKQWNEDERRYTSFVEAFGYIRQLSLYVEIEKRVTGREGWCEPLILAVSKEDPPDIEIIGGIESERIEYELQQVADNMPRILAVKNGIEEATRCECCKYCRSTKQVGRVLHYADIIV